MSKTISELAKPMFEQVKATDEHYKMLMAAVTAPGEGAVDPKLADSIVYVGFMFGVCETLKAIKEGNL